MSTMLKIKWPRILILAYTELINLQKALITSAKRKHTLFDSLEEVAKTGKWVKVLLYISAVGTHHAMWCMGG